MIISISGKAGSGKDTAAKLLRLMFMTGGTFKWYNNPVGLDTDEEFIDERTIWQIKKWAGPLRKIASILLSMPEDYLYTDEFKKLELPVQWNTLKQMSECEPGNVDGYAWMPMTGREFLQKLGTDAVRNGLHQNAWVNALMAEYDKGTEPFWIITDTRFENELKAVMQRDAVTIRINRYPPFVDQDAFEAWRAAQHESETALDYAQFDYVVDNNGTIEDLTNKLRHIYGIISAQTTPSVRQEGEHA
jgi:hypothetical protein